MLKEFIFLCFGFQTSSSLVLDPSFRSDIVRPRQFIANCKDWYNYGTRQTEIAYTLDDIFNEKRKDYIRDQFKKLTSNTCLKAKEYAFNDEECNTYNACIRILERPGGPCQTSRTARKIHLAPYCFNDQWVLHEILHALGFGHEHQRPDRDCYVEVIGDGLTDPQYKKDSNIDISFPYDVHSIMHYRRGYQLKPAKFAYYQHQEFGSRDELTEMDIIALNFMFCGGRHYCDINPERCQYFQCWIECNPCSEEPVGQCRNCTGNTY